MKLSPLFLLASLALNAAVVTFIFLRPGIDATPVAVNPDAPSTALSTGANLAPEAAQAAQLAKAWTQIQSGDLRSLVTQLRAAGFSASMIRTIVAARVSEQFAARRKPLLAAQEEIPFWKSPRGMPLDPKTIAALRDIDKEQSALIKELLGPELLGSNDDMSFYQRRQYGDLPKEKIDQLQNIAKDYGELTQEVYEKAGGILLADDREKLAFIEKERLADIAKLLSPQEFEDYQLRNSPTANSLRWQLAIFNATEDEFRAIHKASLTVEAQLGSANTVRSAADMRKRQEAMFAMVQSSLPPQRLAELKLALDPEYQQINGLIVHLNLPASTSQQVMSLQKDIQQRASTVQNNREIPEEERARQLSALAQEATTKLTNSLGTRGMEAYKQGLGFWLQNLQPRPTTPNTEEN